MSNRKSIIFVLPSLGVGGMQRVASLLSNELVSQNVDVTILTLSSSIVQFFELDSRVKVMRPAKQIKTIFFLIRYFHYITNIKRFVEESKAHKILVFGKIQSALALIALRNRKQDVFISDRASPLQKDSLHILIFTWLVFKNLKPKGIIAQTGVSSDFQKKVFGEKCKIEVIPNPVKEIVNYDYKRENIVLAVGRLGDNLKGFDRLIEAWAHVDAPDWKLIIAGGNEKDDPALIQRIIRLGLADNIQLLDKIEDIDKMYARSSIFVIPSRSEGFPNALAEALCAGLACISFDFCAGPRDMIINNVNGIIVEDNKPLLLGNEITKLINNPDKRVELGTNALLLRNKLNLNSIATKYLNFMYE